MSVRAPRPAGARPGLFGSTAPGIRTCTTTKADGDLRIDGDPVALAERRAAVVAGPWVWLRQVHGVDVVTLTDAAPGEVAGTKADAAVTDRPDVVLAVHTADCVPVVFAERDGPVIAVAHAGWRGLLDGVLPATVAAMRDAGVGDVLAAAGPCIHAECYEFGADDLASVVDRLGPTVASVTAEGRPALDLVAATRRSVVEAGATWVGADPACTACDAARHFSYRARGEDGRQATLVWRPS